MNVYFKLDRDSGIPFFEQIKRKIKDLIAGGRLSEGDLLPSVRELSKILKVNVNTVARAYRELEMEGVVEGKWGYGYVVKGLRRRDWLKSKKREFEKMVEELLSLGVSRETLKNWVDSVGRGEGAEG